MFVTDLAVHVQELIAPPEVGTGVGMGVGVEVGVGMGVVAGAGMVAVPVTVALPTRPTRPSPLVSALLIPLLASIFAVLAIAGLQLASSFLIPIAVALLLTLLLGPLVRGMTRYGVAEPVAAGIIVFGALIVMAGTMVVLSAPATDWLRRAPATMRRVEDKLRTVQPVSEIQATATSV